jgi:hypothetical protein
MKKLLTVVCLSGLLSVPSVVFAEASWYGSLRAALKSSDTAGLADGGSRWGVKGSSEVAEGLTAVYTFEHKIDSTSAGLLGGGRLSFVGLSGGFGTLTLGQVWNAAYNSVGAITDNAYAFGDSETGYRHGHAVSYAVSVENISIQVDAGMNKDGGKTADKNVDQVELGVSMGFGEAGKIAFAHISHDSDRWTKNKSNFVAAEYSIGGMTAYLGAGQTKNTSSRDMKDPTLRVDDDKDEGTPENVDGKVLVMGFDADGDGELEGYEKTLGYTVTTPITEEDGTYTAGTTTLMPYTFDYSENEVIENSAILATIEDPVNEGMYVIDGTSNLGDDHTDVTDFITLVQTYTNAPAFVPSIRVAAGNFQDQKTDKMVFAGIRGSVGDTGVSYLFQATSKKTKGHGSKGTNPDGTTNYMAAKADSYAPNRHTEWLLGLSRSLGGGASVHFEHSNPDLKGVKSTSYLALKVDF